MIALAAARDNFTAYLPTILAILDTIRRTIFTKTIKINKKNFQKTIIFQITNHFHSFQDVKRSETSTKSALNLSYICHIS